MKSFITKAYAYKIAIIYLLKILTTFTFYFHPVVKFIHAFIFWLKVKFVFGCNLKYVCWRVIIYFYRMEIYISFIGDKTN